MEILITNPAIGFILLTIGFSLIFQLAFNLVLALLIMVLFKQVSAQEKVLLEIDRNKKKKTKK